VLLSSEALLQKGVSRPKVCWRGSHRKDCTSRMHGSAEAALARARLGDEDSQQPPGVGVATGRQGRQGHALMG